MRFEDKELLEFFLQELDKGLQPSLQNIVDAGKAPNKNWAKRSLQRIEKTGNLSRIGFTYTYGKEQAMRRVEAAIKFAENVEGAKIKILHILSDTIKES